MASSIRGWTGGAADERNPRSERTKRWLAKNPGYIQQWRADNPGVHASAQAKWIAKNPGYRQQWAKDNPDAVRAADRKYRAANLENVRVADRERKREKRKAMR